MALLIAALVGGIGPTSVPSPRDSAIPPQLLRRFNEWELTFAQGGPAAVAAALSAANQAEMCVGHFWIAIRPHAALYPVLVADLSSPVHDRRLSVVSALEAIPPNQLKPHLGAIRSAAAAESTPGLQRLLGNLSTAVERS